MFISLTIADICFQMRYSLNTYLSGLYRYIKLVKELIHFDIKLVHKIFIDESYLTSEIFTGERRD
jgi:hypothetical protein